MNMLSSLLLVTESEAILQTVVNVDPVYSTPADSIMIS